MERKSRSLMSVIATGASIHMGQKRQDSGRSNIDTTNSIPEACTFPL